MTLALKLKQAKWLLLSSAILAGLSFGAGALLFPGANGGTVSAEDQAAGDHDEHKHDATIWTCSMHPQIRQPEAGLCPICAMDLIPLGSGGAQADTPPNQIVLSERAVALARLRTAPVGRDDDPSVQVRLLGKIEPVESTLRTVTTWVGGRIDRLHVNTTGQRIRAGQTIARLYSPEIYGAHQDLLVAAKQLERLSEATESARSSSRATLEAIRERLALLGVPARDVKRMEQATSPWREISIRSPFAGTVLERLATQGAYVTAGAPLYRIVDLSTVWVQLDAYESDLALIALKQPVELTVEALPGAVFEGVVSFVDPTLDPLRRTARVRVEVRNKGHKLRPGMFVQATVSGGTPVEDGEERPLQIPESAALFTGRRSLVFVELPDADRPTYEARVVRLGPASGGHYPVIAGLRAGERVVVHGAFVLDADLQIRGGSSMMAAPDDSRPGAWDEIVVLPPRQRAALRPLFDPYLQVQVSLAEDDHEAARRAAGTLEKAARRTKIERPRRAQVALAPATESIERHARSLAASETIGAAREHFEKLGKEVETLLRVFGNPLPTPLRLAYCPMAFGNRGATWVQRGDVISNSYFGAAMLKCGEIRSTVDPAGYLPVEEPGDGPGPANPVATTGHQH